MSFEKPVIPGAISTYYSTVQSLSDSAAESLGMWVLEQLKLKYPQHRDVGGLVDIHYQWFFSLDPDTAAKLPSVAIGVMTAEHPRLGSTLNAGDGAIVPGELKDAQILAVVLANNTKLRDGIEDKVGRWLGRIINHAQGSPFRYLTKYDFGDDRGFTQVDRFVISSLWQNLTDEAFVKVTMFNTGYVEAYVEPTDVGIFWNGIAGSAVVTGDIGARVSGLGHRSLRITFTPRAKFDGKTKGDGQVSNFSASRIVVGNELSFLSDTKIVIGIFTINVISNIAIQVESTIQMTSGTTMVPQ